MAGLVDPPHGGAHLVACESLSCELVRGDGLPGNGLGVTTPSSGNPVCARSAERAVTVVDEERARSLRHSRTVALIRDSLYALAMLRLAEPSDADLQRVLEESRHAELTYGEVGATKSRKLPAGIAQTSGMRA